MRPWLKITILSIAIVLVTATVSAAVTVLIMNEQRGERVVLDREEYADFQALAPLLELMDKIKAEHYGEEVTDETLIEGALKGMLQSMEDPYAKYFTDQEYTAYLEEMDGRYHGVGALLGQPQESGLPVLKVYEESPAEKAGLLAGDIITAVDQVAVRGLTLEEAEQLFVGPDGEEITLTVLRAGGGQDMAMTRTAGVVSQVRHMLFLQRTGYIRIDKFAGSAAEEFSEALRDLIDRGMRSLVIDVRNNPGGELRQVLSIADELLGECAIVIVRAKNGEENTHYSDLRYADIPLAILVNENSASASEILAAAIQDTGRGIVVGTGTYGKGVVQTTMQLNSNRGWVKMTTAAYFTPGGLHVDGIGVIPDIEVDLADEIKLLPIDSIAQEDDAQLWAALDVIREQADALDEEMEAPPLTETDPTDDAEAQDAA